MHRKSRAGVPPIQAEERCRSDISKRSRERVSLAHTLPALPRARSRGADDRSNMFMASTAASRESFGNNHPQSTISTSGPRSFPGERMAGIPLARASAVL